MKENIRDSHIKIMRKLLNKAKKASVLTEELHPGIEEIIEWSKEKIQCLEEQDTDIGMDKRDIRAAQSYWGVVYMN